ncbi:MAG TPA: PEGA domain-containing protein, partial [Polyangiaceae bacterium]|nr:PEGA domain-containing protein [Polyangiaceae bacterium]
MLIVCVASLAVVSSARNARADNKADAAHHWETAVGLRDSGDYSGAICELKAAYDLSPEPAVLLALGKAYITLDKPVEAVDALERYLATGRNRIPNENRVEAEIALRKQRERIGSLKVQVTPPGAAVSLDGVELGAAPLAKKIRAAAGRHILVVSLAGYSPTTLEVEVTSAKEKAVELVLQPLPVPKGTVYVECPVPDVLITANGTGIGSTPLTSPALLQSGEYRI